MKMIIAKLAKWLSCIVSSYMYVALPVWYKFFLLLFIRVFYRSFLSQFIEFLQVELE